MALDFQIVLLPRTDYWVWLEACRKYVQKFGANLTPDPEVAARYMAPTQVVTLPVFDGAYPDLGDPIDWFRRNHDGIRLDVIEADNPERLGKVLRRRAKDNDRYGASRRPFHLMWPTDFPVLTQTFGANPAAYRRYGMPGHEGVDLRALTNTNVYACADGEIYEVHYNPKDHAYGIHIRIRHADGYKTVYAHLAKALAGKGELVQAGQLIGRADSTGNSSAAHLHLTLKRDGATARKETIYPKDIIDPTPFLVWPAPVFGKGLEGSRRGAHIGLHLVRTGGLAPQELTAAATAGSEAVMVSHLEPRETIEALRAARSSVRVFARVTEPPANDDMQPARFAARVAGEMGRLYRVGVRDFEVVSCPNEHGGGFGWLWKDGEAFGVWFSEVVRRLREVFPEGRFGFPTLASGGDVTGRQQSPLSFLHQAETAAHDADWLGMACAPDPRDAVLVGYLNNYPKKPIVITELGTEAEASSPEAFAIRSVAFVRALRETPIEVVLLRGLIAGAPAEESTTYFWEALKILAEPSHPNPLSRAESSAEGVWG